MHRGTPASDAIRSIATTVSITSILVAVQGMLTDSEFLNVFIAGFDLFFALYGFGIFVSLFVLYGLWRKNATVEYIGMVMATWLYMFLFLFLGIASYFHAPMFVVCFGLAMIYAIMAAYIKKGKINGEENLGGSAAL